MIYYYSLFSLGLRGSHVSFEILEVVLTVLKLMFLSSTTFPYLSMAIYILSSLKNLVLKLYSLSTVPFLIGITLSLTSFNAIQFYSSHNNPL